MAHRSSKRAATAGAGSRKRRAVANPALEQCEVIAKALSAASREVLPKEAADMLLPMLRPSLTAAKGARHEYQASVVDMVGTVLQNLVEHTEKDVEQRHSAAGAVDTDRAARRAALDEARATMAALEAAAAAKKDALNAAARECSTKSAEQAAAEKVLSEVEKPYTAVVHQLDELKGAAEALNFLGGSAAGATQDGKEHYKKLVKVCNTFDVESDLAELVTKSVKRDPAARQSFDAVAIDNLGNTIQKFYADLEEKMQGLGDPQGKAQEAVRVALEARTAAEEARTTCYNALTEARNAEKAGHHAVKVAEKHLTSWWHDSKVVMDGYDAQVKALAALRDGPLAAFQALRDLAQELAAEGPVAAAVGDEAPEARAARP